MRDPQYYGDKKNRQRPLSFAIQTLRCRDAHYDHKDNQTGAQDKCIIKVGPGFHQGPIIIDYFFRSNMAGLTCKHNIV